MVRKVPVTTLKTHGRITLSHRPRIGGCRISGCEAQSHGQQQSPRLRSGKGWTEESAVLPSRVIGVAIHTYIHIPDRTRASARQRTVLTRVVETHVRAAQVPQVSSCRRKGRLKQMTWATASSLFAVFFCNMISSQKKSLSIFSNKIWRSYVHFFFVLTQGKSSKNFDLLVQIQEKCGIRHTQLTWVRS